MVSGEDGGKEKKKKREKRTHFCLGHLLLKLLQPLVQLGDVIVALAAHLALGGGQVTAPEKVTEGRPDWLAWPNVAPLIGGKGEIHIALDASDFRGVLRGGPGLLRGGGITHERREEEKKREKK